ncbi:Tetratricopeptide domain protein [Pirellula staleyi DSM 6068]|uniref:Tetratricopeptide domain protein n=1 Tax=Pirellula staleyi (strain ATCC 27377 / DSM 6068 / ICPB 4128) TaxID=530564 RepID=D2R0Q2_PIRSD|nr:nuclear scaffold p76 [Pirellula staleyi]ADB16650.1 Tetratricopeptide domain protein [Pirellula staleyi DSM 6068]
MATLVETFKAAEAFKREGKILEAIDKYKELLAQDDSHVLSHLTLAVLYGKVGQHELAVKHGERACELEPTDKFNFTALSTTYQKAFEATQDRAFIFKAEEAKTRANTMEWQR